MQRSLGNSLSAMQRACGACFDAIMLAAQDVLGEGVDQPAGAAALQLLTRLQQKGVLTQHPAHR